MELATNGLTFALVAAAGSVQDDRERARQGFITKYVDSVEHIASPVKGRAVEGDRGPLPTT
jgi:hypothetical protein